MINKNKIPIYMAEVDYTITTSQSKFKGTLSKVIFKGYTIKDLMRKYPERVLNEIKVSRYNELRIDNINLIMHVGYGVKE